MKLRITTFNVQNMFNRYAFLDHPFTGSDFEQTVLATGVVSLASQQGDLVPDATTTIQRNNTAMAILDAKPDILAVQEIENIYTLRNFNEQYLSNYFGHVISLDGNDPRGIDVGLLIKRDITAPDLKSLTSAPFARTWTKLRTRKIWSAADTSASWAASRPTSLRMPSFHATASRWTCSSKRRTGRKKRSPCW